GIAVASVQDPGQLSNHDRANIGRLLRRAPGNKGLSRFHLLIVVSNKEAHENIRIKTNHFWVDLAKRSATAAPMSSFISSMVMLRPFGGTPNAPAKSSNRLLLARTVRTPFSNRHRRAVPSL